MKKILIVSTVSRQFYLFEKGNIEVLKSLGYEVHGAANFGDVNERIDELDIIQHHFDIERSPFSLKNIKAYKQLKIIMKSEKFDVIHCHSPMGGVLARLVAKSVGISTVIYTAHGFHFYKGAPLINWLIYYPIERLLSRFTDFIITINQEDYKRAQNFKTKQVIYIPGIGVDSDKFKIIRDKKTIKEKLGIQDHNIVLLTIGEMIKRKNYETALRAIAKIKDHNFTYLICGRGELENELKGLAQTLGLGDKVKFIGFRNDIPEICIASDVFIFPSYQEGLPVSVMEAMTAGLPIVCSSIRGNIDLIKGGEGGFLHEPKDIEGFAKSIHKIISDIELRERMGKRNLEEAKKYDKKIVIDIMKNVYSTLNSRGNKYADNE